MNIEEKADKVIKRFKREGLLRENASAEAMARFRKKVIQILESEYKNHTSQNAI